MANKAFVRAHKLGGKTVPWWMAVEAHDAFTAPEEVVSCDLLRHWLDDPQSLADVIDAYEPDAHVWSVEPVENTQAWADYVELCRARDVAATVPRRRLRKRDL